MPFFVPHAIIGDRITAGITKLKKTYGYARLISIDEPSPYRVEPPCSFAKKCGGCPLMSCTYDRQLAWKDAQVENAFRRIAGIPEEVIARAKHPIVGMEKPYHFRNKSQYPVGRDSDGHAVIGFYAPHSHRIVPICRSDTIITEWQAGVIAQQANAIDSRSYAFSGCQIAQPLDTVILEAVLVYMEEMSVLPYDERTGKGTIRHVLIRHGLRTGEVMICLVVNADRLPHEEWAIDLLYSIPGVASLVLNVNKRRDNVILGQQTRLLWGRERIADTLLGNRFLISAKSFYQVNPAQTERLYQKAVDYAALSGTEVVWDLYCGIGTISLCMAKKARQVIGIEVIEDAISDAKENAKINGIQNVTFLVGRAEDILKEHADQPIPDGDTPSLAPPDVVVVDPPRKGLDEIVIRAILAASPKRIVYVSCNPATLARDVKLFLDGGEYQLDAYTPFDQFGHSVHVETICMLRKQNRTPDTYIELEIDADEYMIS